MEHLRGEHLLAAEREQLPGERGRAVRRLADLLDVLPLGILLSQVDQQEIGIGGNGRQDVVEVVGHPTRQPAHGLHLLCLPVLILQQLDVGNVRGDADASGDPTGRVEEWRRRHAEVHRLSVFAASNDLHRREHLPTAEHPVPQPAVLLLLLFRNEGQRPPNRLLRRPPENPLRSGVPTPNDAIEVFTDDGVVR